MKKIRIFREKTGQLGLNWLVSSSYTSRVDQLIGPF
jgi:hypothetical protein